MSGALFVLAITLAVTVVMATGFLAVALFDKRNIPARWFALAFALGILSSAGEYVIGAGIVVDLARLIVALALLAALLIVTQGLFRRSGRAREWPGLVSIFAASSLLYCLTLDLPRDDFLRLMLYQLPYALVSLLALSAAWQVPRRKALDWLLMGLLLLTALHFIAKPYLAGLIGGVGLEAEQYITTAYALLSQTAGSILSLSVGVVLLLLVASDSALRFIRYAERDAATGLLSERGFSERVSQHLKEAGDKSMALTLLSVKSGDGAPSPSLASYIARTLEAHAAPELEAGHVKEFVFALFDRDATLFSARRQAEKLLSILSAADGPKGALGSLVICIGIADREPGDGVSDMLGRAQWALEEARRSGGNCVRLAVRSQLSAVRRPRAC